MAEAASAVPTFKLVLVGDGGTGKVRSIDLLVALLLVLIDGFEFAFIPIWAAHFEYCSITNHSIDHVCQAPFDWRIRKEVHRHSWC
jgi:hypothetical protein